MNNNNAFGIECLCCGEFNATRLCLACLARETGATITSDARGTLVIMPTNN